ncbi:TetR/AcrR family transcriptional regulator [Nocardia sp. NPDC057668]|uniref:TetR/AcrR family transcriptional regulator n=1 Tax=Nocardia sp. NPDC057668 TaxID=3346202 RepID=UPI0036726F13
MTPTTSHPYNGLSAEERVAKRREKLLEVGLDILGARDSPGELTLRNVCQQAGLSQRYFYESFADKDEFAADIYEWSVQELTASIQLAVANAPRKEKLRAGIGELVRGIEADYRLGRLLFSPNQINPALLHKRYGSTQGFIELLDEHIREATPAGEYTPVPLAAQFLVGGVGQIVSSWFNGTTASDTEALVDSLVEFLAAYWRQLAEAHGRAGASTRTGADNT